MDILLGCIHNLLRLNLFTGRKDKHFTVYGYSMEINQIFDHQIFLKVVYQVITLTRQDIPTVLGLFICLSRKSETKGVKS